MSIKIINQGRVNNLFGDNAGISNNDNRDFLQNSNLKGNSNYTESEVRDAVNKLNKELQKEKSHAEYSYYEKLNTITVKIIDDTTDEIIMELPPEKILNLISKMCELNGVIVDKDA
jgi:flagellar protein FlaG